MDNMSKARACFGETSSHSVVTAHPAPARDHHSPPPMSEVSDDSSPVMPKNKSGLHTLPQEPIGGRPMQNEHHFIRPESAGNTGISFSFLPKHMKMQPSKLVMTQQRVSRQYRRPTPTGPEGEAKQTDQSDQSSTLNPTCISPLPTEPINSTVSAVTQASIAPGEITDDSIPTAASTVTLDDVENRGSLQCLNGTETTSTTREDGPSIRETTVSIDADSTIHSVEVGEAHAEFSNTDGYIDLAAQDRRRSVPGDVNDETPNISSHSVSPISVHGRIGKRYRRSMTPNLSEIDATTLYQPNTAKSAQPSEEDLMLLLMHRRRINQRSVSQLVRDHRTIQQERSLLLKDNKALNLRLSEQTSKLANVQAENALLHSQLQKFCDKYDKIKAWALEINQQLADLRDTRSEVSDGLLELKTHGVSLQHEVVDLQRQNVQSEQSLCKLKSELTAAITSSKDLTTKLILTGAELSERCTESTKMSITLQKYESHIRHLTTNHQQLSREQDKHQAVFAQQLSSLSERLIFAESQLRSDNNTSECLQLLHILSKKDSASRVDLMDLNSALISLSDKVDTLEHSWHSDLNAAGEKLLSYLESSHFRDIKAILQSILKKCTISDDILSQRESAESRATELQKLVGDLVLAITKHKSEDQARDNGPDSRINELTIKWTCATKALKESETLRERSDLAVQRLSTELRVEQEDCIILLAECQSGYEQQIHDLKQDMALRETEHAAEIRMLGAIESATIAEAELELLREKAQYAAAQEQNRIMSLEVVDLKNRLQTMCDQISDNTSTLAIRQEELSESHRVMLEAHSRAALVPGLEAELNAKNTELIVAKNRLLDYDTTKQHLASVQRQYSEANKELHRASADTSKLQTAVKDLDNMNAEVLNLQMQLVTTQNQLETAEAKAATVESLSEDLSRKNIELLVMQAHLTALHKETQRSSDLQDENKRLEQEISDLKQSLYTAKQQVDQVTALASDAREKQIKINELEQQLGDLGNIAGELEGVREQARRRNNELRDLQERIDRILRETQRLDSDADQIPGDVLNAWSQEIELSIQSLLLPDSQNQDIPRSPNDINDSFIPMISANHADDGSHKTIEAQVATLTQSSMQDWNQFVPQSQCPAIPDSQDNMSARMTDIDNTATTGTNGQPRLSSSSLTEPPESGSQMVDSDDDQQSERVDEDRLYDLPQSSSPPLPRLQAKSVKRPHRPGSAASQESMLLQTTPRNRAGRQHNSRVDATVTEVCKHKSRTSKILAVGQPPAQRLEIVERTTRSQTPSATAKPQPNSAAKRQHDVMIGASAEPDGKRLRRTTTNLDVRPPPKSRSSATTRPDLSSASLRSNNLLTGSRTGLVSDNKTSAIPNLPRKGKSGRKSSRHERYTARFDDHEDS